MRRKFVFLTGLAAIVVSVGGGAYLVHRYHQDLMSLCVPDSAKSHTLDETKKLSDRELVEAVAAGEAPWDLMELKARCSTYSAAQLDAVAEVVVEIAFPMNDRYGEASRFLEDVRSFLPAQHAEQTIRRAHTARALEVKKLEEYVGSQNSPDGSHTPEDAERLHQLYVDLDGTEKYPQVFEHFHCLGSTRDRLKSDALEGLTYCGAPGLEKLRLLGQSGRVLAAALVRTGRPEDIDELVALCQDKSVPQSQFAYIVTLASLEASRRTTDTRETLRTELVPFFRDPDPQVRTRAAHAAAGSEDTCFLPALDDLAVNDPYYRDDKRSVSGGVHVEQAYERYTVRESAAWAAEKIRMLDPKHQAMREAEKERRRRLIEVFSLESNLIGLRSSVMDMMYNAPSADASTTLKSYSRKSLERLAESRNDRMRELADLRSERAQILGEEDLEWHTTEWELLTAIADGDEKATELLSKRCTDFSEQWLEEIALLVLDIEERVAPQAAHRLVVAADRILPERVRGPMAEYRLARDGDDAAKEAFAARVAAGMTTGRPLITMLHRLYLQVEDPTTQAGAALVDSYRQAVLFHGQRASFSAPGFLTSHLPMDRKPADFVLDGLAEKQKTQLLEYRELKDKVRQIDYQLADVAARDWVVSAITNQRVEARRRMDTVWRELHRVATAAVTAH